ncbi:hypothetical protein ACM66B_005635 [Microbotryomycetes sp. NB124-2]
MAPVSVHKKPSSLTLKIDAASYDTGTVHSSSPTLSTSPLLQDKSRLATGGSNGDAGSPVDLHLHIGRTPASNGGLMTPVTVPKSFFRAKTLIAAFLAIVASFILISSIVHPPSSSYTTSSSFSYNSPLDVISNNKPLPKCTAEQLLKRGEWTRRRPVPKTIQDVIRAYKYRPYKALTNDRHGILNTYETRDDGMYCAREFSKLQTDEMRKQDEQRLIEVAGWQWTSESVKRGECEVEEWDWKKVVKRLIMSRAGIIFLGDSITAQQYDSFALLLGNDVDKGPIIERVLSPPARRLDATRALFLDPLHPLTTELVAEIESSTSFGKVPRERLNRPIAQTMRSDFLVTEQDVINLELDQKHGKTRIRPTEFDSLLSQLVNYPSSSNSVGGAKDDEPNWMTSIVVTSVGNWWERYIDSSTSVSSTLIKFKQAMSSTFLKLDSLARTKKFTIVYRSVNRGTVDCQNYKEPFQVGGVDGQQEDLRAMDQVGQHAWYLKQPMADVWRTLLHNVTTTTTTTSTPSLTNYDGKDRKRWINLDIVEMAYQRPDAHRFPPDDCLHWCLPSVLDDWNWAMWHLVQRNEPMH